MRQALVVLVWIPGFLVPAGAQVWAEETPAPAELAEVRAFIQESVRKRVVPSVAVAVVRDDKVIWAEGFGYANVERQIDATADSIYRLASISKPFTATGLMILKDRGQIDLDAPANRYLPGAKLRAYVGSAESITIRRLANHTSGLPLHYTFFYDGVKPPPRDASIRRYGFAATRPGTDWQYSNLGFGILDYITEVVAETPWREFMEKEVYDPLGMTHTSDRVRPGKKKHAAMPYTRDVAGRFLRIGDYRFDHPGASAVRSSANDLARFARLHMNGGRLDGVRILSEASTRAMQEPTAERPGGSRSYGIGWVIEEFGGKTSISHSGGMPGVSTLLRLILDDDTAAVVLTNMSGHPLTGQIMSRIGAVLYPEATSASRDRSRENTPTSEEAQNAWRGRWQGRLAHFDGDIPVTLMIDEGGAGHVHLGTVRAVELAELRLRDDRLTAHLHGKLWTVPAFVAPMRISLRLRRDGDRATGVATAQAPEMFALSHWVDLTRQVERPSE